MNALARLTVLVAAVVSAALLPSAARAQVPADDVEVILTIDTSESMQPAIENAKAAANEFIAAMPTDVRIGVETFSDSVTVLAPPTTDRGLLNLQIALITTGGDTALYDGVVGASQRFSPDAAHKVLVVLSDGKDEGSAATLDDARLAATNLHVEAISLATALSDVESLAALGFVTSADDPAGVSAAFARVAGLVVEVIETAPTTTAAPTTTMAPTTTAAPATTAAPEPTVAAVTQTQQAPPTTPAVEQDDQARRRCGCGSAPPVSSSACSSSARCSSPSPGLEGSARDRQATDRFVHGREDGVSGRRGARALRQTGRPRRDARDGRHRDATCRVHSNRRRRCDRRGLVGLVVVGPIVGIGVALLVGPRNGRLCPARGTDTRQPSPTSSPTSSN